MDLPAPTLTLLLTVALALGLAGWERARPNIPYPSDRWWAARAAGFGMAGGKSRSWAHMLGFALIMSFAVYVILDLEFPRVGLIRIDDADRALTTLRESMK